MNYVEQLEVPQKKVDFEKMHASNWEEKIVINSNFALTKKKQSFANISDVNVFDLIYFDAFGFTVQPELWNEEIFEIMYKSLKNRGILTTYACRTSIKKAMQHVGFQTLKLPGAPGKREMLRALKNW